MTFYAKKKNLTKFRFAARKRKRGNWLSSVISTVKDKFHESALLSFEFNFQLYHLNFQYIYAKFSNVYSTSTFTTVKEKIKKEKKQL